MDKGVPAAAAAITPAIWSVLGYQFEAGSMIAGLCSCVAVRFYVAQRDKEHRWLVDMPVTVLTLLFTAGFIIAQRPEPFTALLAGTGFGALGAGIISIALKWIRRVTGEDEAKLSTPVSMEPRRQDDRDIGEIMRDLNQVPGARDPSAEKDQP